MAARSPHPRRAALLVVLGALLLGAACLLLLVDRPPPGPVDEGSPAAAGNLAERLFDEAAAWVNRGSAPALAPHAVYLALDATFELDTTRSEGPMRLWLQQPDKFRQEMMVSNSPQTKLLNAENLWIAGADGRFRHMNRTADGQGALRQAQEDRERLLDITTFLTLQGLKGPGVTFEYLGETNPSGSYARQEGGSWAKLVRKAPGRPNITFWLAHVTDAQGLMRATYPGVVRVDGEPQNNIPTEDYILQDWADRPSDPPRLLRFPRRILAFELRPDQRPLNFLRAGVADIEIDADIDPARFAPPAQPAGR